MVLLRVDLVSPSGQILSGVNTEKVLVPSMDGQITILPGHRDMMCLLGRGLLFIDGVDEKYVVYGGVLQTFDGGSVNIAADRIVKTSSLNEPKLEGLIREIEQKLNSETLDDKEYNKLMGQYLDHIVELNSL